VQVDYIDAEYEQAGKKGFDKRYGAGYNGGKATKKGGDGGSSGGGGHGSNGDGANGKDGGLVGQGSTIAPGSQLTDE